MVNHLVLKLTAVAIISINTNVLAANILIVLPLLSRSHYNVIKPVIQELCKIGHNVTALTAYKEENLSSNYRHVNVDILPLDKLFAREGKDTKEATRKMMLQSSKFIQVFFFYTILYKALEISLEAEDVNEFIKNDQSHFDLIIIEDLNFLPYYMLAYKYKAPLITFLAYNGAHYVNDYMGNPMSLHYVPHEFYDAGVNYSIVDKIKSIGLTFYVQLLRLYYFMPKYNELARKHFSHLPQPLPDLREIEKNISLVFLNTHFTFDHVRSYLPNMVEFAGTHVKDPEPLPKDLQLTLNNAKHGVIYFSLGSNIRSNTLSKEKIDVLLQVFSKLKQIVVWKWEDDILPGKPDNVVIGKWFPQNDLLAHPNIRLFISHGGQLSTIETIYRGVPILGIPIVADQPINTAKAKRNGIAEMVDIGTLSVDSLHSTLEKMLNDPSYKDNAKRLSNLIKDRPSSAMENTIYWIEYVIRHRGAYHMKSPSSWMPWYQYYLLDVIAFIGILIIFLVYLLAFIIKRLFKAIFKSKNKETKSSNKSIKKKQ